jgi:hypothetical protein
MDTPNPSQETDAVDGKKTRLITMTVTGAKLVEALDDVNEEAKSIKFHVVESPFPIANCNTEVSRPCPSTTSKCEPLIYSFTPFSNL